MEIALPSRGSWKDALVSVRLEQAMHQHAPVPCTSTDIQYLYTGAAGEEKTKCIGTRAPHQWEKNCMKLVLPLGMMLERNNREEIESHCLLLVIVSLYQVGRSFGVGY